MAYSSPEFAFTAKSSGDMSSAQYHLVTLSTTNSADGCILGPSALGGHVHGVWLGNSTAAEHGPVQFSGIAKVQLSSATEGISLGEILTGSTQTIGRAVASTSTGNTLVPIGYAMEAAASGSTAVISVMLNIGYKLDATA